MPRATCAQQLFPSRRHQSAKHRSRRSVFLAVPPTTARCITNLFVLDLESSSRALRSRSAAPTGTGSRGLSEKITIRCLFFRSLVALLLLFLQLPRLLCLMMMMMMHMMHMMHLLALLMGMLMLMRLLLLLMWLLLLLLLLVMTMNREDSKKRARSGGSRRTASGVPAEMCVAARLPSLHANAQPAGARGCCC